MIVCRYLLQISIYICAVIDVCRRSIMSKKLRCSYTHINMGMKKKGAYRSCYNNQSVDNVRFVEQDHCFSSSENYYLKKKKKRLVWF